MSDDLRKHAEENRIVEVVAGSQLYGTATPESDTDYVGVFMPPEEYVLGLKSVQEVDLSVKYKTEDGKNAPDAVDRKLIEFRKFINLALGNNPNILEILYAPESAIVFDSDTWTSLIDIRHLFPSKFCVPKLLGYASSQKHKMIIRRDHFNELSEGHEVLKVTEDKLTMAQLCDRMEDSFDHKGLFFKKDIGHHIHCGDICFEPGTYVKKARRMLKDRLDKATNRSELVTKYGYDCKFGSHLIRLLYECIMLLERQELIFPLPMASQLIDIKQGKWNISEVLDFANKLENKCKQLEQTSELRAKPDYRQIETFTIRTMKHWLERK